MAVHFVRTRISRLRRKLRKVLQRPRLVVNSEDILELLPRSLTSRRLAGGFRFTEGPLWIAETESLLFSDIPASRIYRIDSEGSLSVFRDPSGFSNGLTLDMEGRIIACEHGNRRVTRTEADGTITVLADHFDGKQLNSPNDVIVAPDGSILFTDPPFGIESHQQELPFQGVYRVTAPGRIDILADDFDRPNGLALSPDGATLYVDDSVKMTLRAFSFSDGASLDDGRILADMTATGVRGCPDGMKIDCAGNIYCTGPGGIWILDHTGRHLGTIIFPEQPANCAWGGPDNMTLYVTAETSVYSIRTLLPGMLTPDRK